MVNSNKWVYTADLEIKLNVKIKGSSKDKKSKALDILKNPKTYDMMLYPSEFDSKNIKITVNKSCTMVTLSIKDVKLLFFTGVSIPKTNAEILADLNENLKWYCIRRTSVGIFRLKKYTGKFKKYFKNYTSLGNLLYRMELYQFTPKY